VAGSIGALEEDCGVAAMVIARFAVPSRCRETTFVIDRRDVAHHGAHALYADGEDESGRPIWRVRTAYPDVRRPFMPAVSGDRP
jgi:hypothetical protein